MKLQNLSAWERLQYINKELTTILEKTKKGKKISEDEEIVVHQELLIAVGTIANFSDCLSKGEIHG
ncbi:hypothetical protein ACYSNW_01405 [Enterococcus sp. LJL99]